MSLYKQLWLAIVFLLTLVFGGSFVVSSLSAKAYLEQQLFLKNTDNASALALSLTQQGADPVLLELVLSAQFDTGHYQLIELRGPTGEILIHREDTSRSAGAPRWFTRLLPIEVEPGVAQVQKGWQQIGTLTLRSHSRFAYRELWQSTKKLAVVFLVAMLGAGLLGSYLLRIILRPLDDVVTQAEALGQRRFITISEPRTREFRQVVSAMNTLSERIKQALRQEAARLEKWQRDSHVDRITGLRSRDAFMQDLEALLEGDDVNATGTVTLLRLVGLSELNQNYGRKAIDAVLGEIGNAIGNITSGHSRWGASRLNGSDFALVAPRATDPKAVAQQLHDSIAEILEARSMRSEVRLPCASTIYLPDDTIPRLMTRLDGALIAADREGLETVNVTYAGDVQMMPVREQMAYWKEVLRQAFLDNSFSLGSYPVIGRNGSLLHFEAPVRLQADGNQLTAGVFLPWINRLEMSSELDQHVVDLALRIIPVRDKPVCINLSVGALVEPAFLLWFSDRLVSAGEAAKKLWVELPEAMAFRHLEAFKRLSARAKSCGCKVGIEHVGHQLSDLSKLHDVGLDYLKVDASFVRNIESNSANQTLLRTLCTVGHSIGVIVIAEGVRSSEEWRHLEELGLDGATGPGITEMQGREQR